MDPPILPGKLSVIDETGIGCWHISNLFVRRIASGLDGSRALSSLSKTRLFNAGPYTGFRKSRSDLFCHRVNIPLATVGRISRAFSRRNTHSAMILFGVLATGLAMFAMVITKTEHPPAAVLALGLVLNEWSMLTIVVVFAGALGLSVCKQLVLPFLLDLH